jgi:hypothetical protein
LDFPTFTLPDDTVLCSNQSITVDVGNGFEQYLWSTGATTSSVNIDSSGYGLGTHPIYVKVSNSNGCSTTKNFFITWDICVGLPVIETNIEIEIFPNPTHEFVTISVKGQTGNAQISLFSGSTQEIARYQIGTEENNHNRNIALYSLPAGIYFIRFSSSESVIVKKIIVIE